MKPKSKSKTIANKRAVRPAQPRRQTRQEQIANRVQSVEHLIFKLASKNAKYLTPGGALDLDDLISAGNIGAWFAAERFNEKFGTKFVTYAWQYIQGYISKELRSHNRTVHIPQICSTRSEKNRQEILLAIKSKTVGLDETRSCYNENELSAEDMVIRKSDITFIFKEMDKYLTEQEKYVLVKHFIDENTLKEIGKQIGGLSKEGVRHIEISALTKLKYLDEDNTFES